MYGIKKTIIALLVVSFMVLSFASSATAYQTTNPPSPDPTVMMADFFVARPIGFAAMVVGTASFIVSLPFSALGDNVNQACNLMIVDPAVYTFKRPLGGF